jgi:beta-1,4-galactosyltransferase 1
MKLGVCVPYRNRESHLKEFIPTVGKYLEEQGIEYCMYFGHQTDDKLFNRGAMKNIAAEQAFKDGCDYIVWHDIDMIPEEGCDYSFPKENPIHIATNISQMDYKLKYEEYFGGAVIFSKEQVDRTNGYSNDYWDWGMEDDDLFWRCQLEGYANNSYMEFHQTPQTFLHFNGKSSHIKIDKHSDLRNVTSRSHTISVLVRANQQEEKVPIWLVGDTERRFCEYPIIRRPGYDYGISYNNSRAYTAQLWDNEQNHLYQWMKRYENQWSWVTLSVDTISQNIHFYLNGKESDARHGTGTQSPLHYENRLKSYGLEDWFIGTTTSVGKNEVNRWFKGDIADVKIWNRALSPNEIQQIHTDFPLDGLKLHYNFNHPNQKNSPNVAIDLSGNGTNGSINRCEERTEEIKIPYTTIPHRIPGRLRCLPHTDEGLIKVGGVDKWAKGETTARNERRYVLQMQQGEWDYKSDGINSLKYDLISIEELTPSAKMINVKL